MAKKNAPVVLRLNLLKPQGIPEKSAVRFIRWLLSVGRFIIVLVEALVLVAFVSRFKFDADLETLKENIDAQIPYIESLRNDENLIRQTQMQLSYIFDKRINYPDYELVLKKIAQQTPQKVKVSNLNLEKSAAKTNVKISGSALSNLDISSFVTGLKSDKFFGEVNLIGVGLDQGVITFNISVSAPAVFIKEQSL